MSLERLCFILVEREKTNKIRRLYLSRYYSDMKKLNKLTLKDPEFAKHLMSARDNHNSYRRVADLMNGQRKMLRDLRKDTGGTPKYNSANYCTHVEFDGYTLTIPQIRDRHASYLFDVVVLGKKTIDNPYAKEIYGETKEIKQV